jgi:hypothetical protein
MYRTVGNEGLTSAMTNPMSNIAFDMAAATLSNGNAFKMLFRMRRLPGKRPSWRL